MNRLVYHQQLFRNKRLQVQIKRYYIMIQGYRHYLFEHQQMELQHYFEQSIIV